jgi:recombinational DNA repair ATPase RecF
MLRQIVLSCFKSHQRTSFWFDDSRIHTFVGKNSSGKTSVLEAIYYLSQLYSHSLKDIFQGESSPEFLVTVGEKMIDVGAMMEYKEAKPIVSFKALQTNEG